METFQNKMVIIPRTRDYKSIDETDKYSLRQRLSCKVIPGKSPLQLWSENPSWTLNDLKEKIPLCTLYPFPVGIKVLSMFKPKRWLDPTAGWGDRLRCAIKYGCEYVGVDSNRLMQPAYKQIISELGDPYKQRVIAGKFQNVKIDGKFDLVFTSPPFFTKEVYDEMVQWKTVDDFLKEFLKPLLRKSEHLLQKNGHLVLYIEGEGITEMKQYVSEKLPSLSYLGVFYYEGAKLRPYYVWRKV